MNIEFDPDKDAINLVKHGVSLGLVAKLDVLAHVVDHRYAEPRFRLYGLIDGLAYCAAGTDRDGVVRVINLRRVHKKELRKYVSRTTGHF